MQYCKVLDGVNREPEFGEAVRVVQVESWAVESNRMVQILVFLTTHLDELR